MTTAHPPINSLRAFEAVARHRSFTRAAEELHVTQGALSHQVRGLESFLGCALFERQARGVSLTQHGQALYPGLVAGFGLIRDAVDSLRSSTSQNVMVLSTPPGFTSKWLTPRLYKFFALHPEVELRVASTSGYANFRTDGVDAAIRNIPVNRAREPELAYDKLVDVNMVAVCSPQLLAASSQQARRRALSNLPLIHDDQLAGQPEVPSWSDWFRAAGVARPAKTNRGPHFSSADHALDAAIQGAGLLLTHSVLAQQDLRSGRLVQPLSVALPSGRAYYFVSPAGLRDSASVAAFRGWLFSEATSQD
jgi:LysR family glycine cleavage system transcriptional activator